MMFGHRIDANWWPLVDANRVEFPSLGLTSCKFLLVRLFHVCQFFSSNKFGGSVVFEPWQYSNTIHEIYIYIQYIYVCYTCMFIYIYYSTPCLVYFIFLSKLDVFGTWYGDWLLRNQGSCTGRSKKTGDPTGNKQGIHT